MYYRSSRKPGRHTECFLHVRLIFTNVGACLFIELTSFWHDVTFSVEQDACGKGLAEAAVKNAAARIKIEENCIFEVGSRICGTKGSGGLYLG